MRESDSSQCRGLGTQRFVLGDKGIDHVGLREEGQLHRDLECALACRQTPRQGQDRLLPIVEALGPELVWFVRADRHGDAVLIAKQSCQLQIHCSHGQPVVHEHPLGSVVENGDVVLSVVEEVPNFFVRHGHQRHVRCCLAGQLRRELVQLLCCGVKAAVQHHEGASDRRHSGHQFVHLCQRYVPGFRGFSQGVMNVRNESCVGIGSEELHVEIELGVELEKDGDGQRSLIVLELIDITGESSSAFASADCDRFRSSRSRRSRAPAYIFFIESPRCRSGSPYREAIRNIRNIAGLLLHK